MSIYIDTDRVDEFVAHLQTLPAEEAVALARDAVRGPNQAHNTRVLFPAKSFVKWLMRKDVQAASYEAAHEGEE